MKQAWLVIAVAVLMLSACGKKNEENNAVTNAPAPPQSAETSMQPLESMLAETTASTVVESKPNQSGVSASGGSALGRDEGLALAGKSGCMACHQIDTKLVGPAWRDVSKRYKGDAGAKALLIEKVKMGGKGNWTQVTGGIPMPPNSPRVSDEDIKKLVTFVLAL